MKKKQPLKLTEFLKCLSTYQHLKYEFFLQWWQVDKVSPIKLFDENKSLCGLNMRHLMYQQGGAQHIQNVMTKVFDLWKKGKIKPVVDSTWALEDVSHASLFISLVVYCNSLFLHTEISVVTSHPEQFLQFEEKR